MADENFNDFVSRDLTSYSGSVEKIGKGAFCYSENLESVEAPEATLVGDFAFQNCPELAEVDISNCRSLGSYAFWNCRSLTSINIPLVNRLQAGAFQGCKNLETVQADEVQRVGIDAFHDTNLGLIDFPKAKLIQKYAFKNCGNLETPKTVTVKLPAVEAIKDYAFENSSIEEIWLGSIRTLGAGVFKNCRSLQTVHLCDVQSIGANIFEGCTQAIDLYTNTTFAEGTFPSNVTVHEEEPTIGGILFDLHGCTSENCSKFTFYDAAGTEIEEWETEDDLKNACWVTIDPTQEGQATVYYLQLSPELTFSGNYTDIMAVDIDAYSQVLSGDIFTLRTETDENNELVWDPVRAYYESADSVSPIRIFNDDGSSNSELLTQVKEKFFNNEIYVRVYTSQAEGEGKTFCDALLTSGLAPVNTPGTIFEYLKSQREANLNGASDWYIGSKGDLAKLQEKASENYDTVIAEWFNNNNIWSCSEGDSLRAWRWDFSDARNNYGTFKALADLYIRNLYLDPETPGQNLRMYKAPILADDEEHTFIEDNTTAYDFTSQRVTLEDFPELLENVAEEGEEPEYVLKDGAAVTPEICIRRAYEDCCRGTQSFTLTPYVVTYGRDYYGDFDAAKPVGLFKVGQTKRFNPVQRVMRTITYTEPFKLDTEFNILPIDFSGKYYEDQDNFIQQAPEGSIAGADVIAPIPNCLTTGHNSPTVTFDDVLEDIYDLDNIKERYEGTSPMTDWQTSVYTLASEMTNAFTEEPTDEAIQSDLAKYPSLSETYHQGDYTGATSVSQPSLISDYCNNIMKYRTFSGQQGKWELESKKGKGRVILLRTF